MRELKTLITCRMMFVSDQCRATNRCISMHTPINSKLKFACDQAATRVDRASHRATAMTEVGWKAISVRTSHVIGHFIICERSPLLMTIPDVHVGTTRAHPYVGRQRLVQLTGYSPATLVGGLRKTASLESPLLGVSGLAGPCAMTSLSVVWTG